MARSSDEKREPNDDALHSALKKAGRADVQRLALLTSDLGFVESLSEVQARGTSVLAFVPRAWPKCSSFCSSRLPCVFFVFTRAGRVGIVSAGQHGTKPVMHVKVGSLARHSFIH